MSQPGIPLLDLTRDKQLLDALSATAERVIRSGRYILGPEVTALEAECAEYCGVKHAIAVSSGTDALLLSLMTLGVGPGDEVICPTYTFFATAGTIHRLGATPVFVDSLPGTYNLDPARVGASITPRTKAIIPVHLYGQCVDMDALAAVAGDIPIVEDACQAIGAEYGGRRAGGLGTFGCFSFFPSKNLGALGDAGLVTCDDDELADRARILRTHGGRPKYFHKIVGGDFRMDALQAALLRVKLPRLDHCVEARQAVATRYTERLSQVQGVTPPVARPGRRHVFHQYVIAVEGEGRRDALRDALTERGIGSAIYYPVPLHVQECFADLGHKEGDMPVAEAAARQTLALPMFPELTEGEIDRVCGVIAELQA